MATKQQILDYLFENNFTRIYKVPVQTVEWSLGVDENSFNVDDPDDADLEEVDKIDGHGFDEEDAPYIYGLDFREFETLKDVIEYVKAKIDGGEST